jgi:hypothetical protein
MNGSATAQFLFQSYGADLAAIVPDMVATVLAISAGAMAAIAQIIVFMLAKRALYGNLAVDTAVTYMVRFGVISLLMVPATFNKYITTTATQTLPNRIASTINGNQGGTVAQAFDGELNAIDNLGAKLRAQAVGWSYMVERGIINVWVGWAKGWIYLTECIFGIVNSVIPFMLPMGALLAPMMVFDTTNQWPMRWIGKMISLFLVMFLSIQLGAYIAKVDAKYLQQYGQMIQSTPAQPQFKMNAGDSLFASLGIVSEVGALGAGAADPTASATTTANVAAGISTLANIAWTMAYGFFVLTIVTGIAMFIGGAHGFSLAPIVAAGTSVARLALRRA